MCRFTAAHKTIRLMLLGLPPDMVHGALLHRTRTPIFRRFIRKIRLIQKSESDVIIIPHSEINFKYFFTKKYFFKKLYVVKLMQVKYKIKSQVQSLSTIVASRIKSLSFTPSNLKSSVSSIVRPSAIVSSS